MANPRRSGRLRLGPIRLLLSILALAAILAVPALAVGPGSGFGPPPKKKPPPKIPPGTGGGGGSIPEMDPGAAAGALTLLFGATLILTDRLRHAHGPRGREHGIDGV